MPYFQGFQASKNDFLMVKNDQKMVKNDFLMVKLRPKDGQKRLFDGLKTTKRWSKTTFI